MLREITIQLNEARKIEPDYIVETNDLNNIIYTRISLQIAKIVRSILLTKGPMLTKAEDYFEVYYYLHLEALELAIILWQDFNSKYPNKTLELELSNYQRTLSFTYPDFTINDSYLYSIVETLKTNLNVDSISIQEMASRKIEQVKKHIPYNNLFTIFYLEALHRFINKDMPKAIINKYVADKNIRHNLTDYLKDNNTLEFVRTITFKK